MMTLRQYQRESIDAIYDYFYAGGGNPLVVLPTGAGKSLVIAALCQELMEQNPAMRIAVVTHAKELISQNFMELIKLWPSAPAGIYSAGVGRRDTHSRILFCGIQSVWNKVDMIGAFDLVIVDEAHMIPNEADTTYVRFIEDLRAKTPDFRVIGLTATPYRMKSGRLDRGEGKLFDDIVYEANVSDLIRDGYLSPLISKATANEFDVAGVAKRGGDFVPGALEVAINKDWIVREAVAELVQLGEARRAWLVFCAGVHHAQAVRDEVRTHGISCEVVTGETEKGVRDRVIRQFSNGEIRCLTNVNVLSTGFNVPHVDLIGLMRPTMSTGLYVQQVGRAFRRAPGKENALILDWAGAVRRHGPVDAINVLSDRRAKGSGAVQEGDIRAKACPACNELVAIATRTCPCCGHEWPVIDKPKHEAVADATTPILTTEPPVWVRVDDIRYFRHAKEGKTPSMRVEYGSGMQVFREWICFEHEPGSFPRQKAEQWWRERGEGGVPATVEEALRRSGDVLPPGEIRVRHKGKFWEIIGRRGAYEGEPPVAEQPAYEPAHRPWQHTDLDDEIPF